MSDQEPPTDSTVTLGQTVYDERGEAIGTIRGFNEDGFFVTTRDGIEALSIEHERAGHEFGEAELLWRCSDCGEIGDIAEMPDSCPSCGAPREALYYWTED